MKNLLTLLLMLPLFACAQLSHTVKAKETLYSLARKYNVHPRELAAYNNIPVETGLVLGQVIRIPAKTTMAPLSVPPPATTAPVIAKPETQAAPVKIAEQKPVVVEKAESSGNKPIYHKVAKKETLYAISKKYNNVSIADIKKWNRLTTDGLSEGTNLIVGYGQAVAVVNAVPENQDKATRAEPVKQVNAEANQPAPKVVQAKTEPVAVKIPEPAVKEKETPVTREPVKEAQANITGKDFRGGVFKELYEQQSVNRKAPAEESGTAGIFKSTSGWEDGKYYCLSNSVPAGTIVKITYPATRKSVYAKVLDLIPDLKQNAGIIIRLSNAAAQELGVNADIFECTINF